MTPFSRSKQQQQTPYSSIIVMITSQIILLLHQLEEKALKTSREMKEQHLFLGKPADRREPLTAAAPQAPPSPARPLPRRLHAPQDTPQGGWQPGCCTHPHLESALRPLLQHTGNNSLELMESSAINRVFPVPPHAQCHYTALTLYQHRAQTAKRRQTRQGQC